VSTLVVYDTMLFFQAASQPHRIHATMKALTDGRLILCVSPELIGEVTDVLTRPEYRVKFPALTPTNVAAFLNDLQSRAQVFDPVPRVFTWPEHPDDDHVFNLSIHARARYLVTWETRILRLHTAPSDAAELLKRLAPDLSIVTPKVLADLLKTTGRDEGREGR